MALPEKLRFPLDRPGNRYTYAASGRTVLVQARKSYGSVFCFLKYAFTLLNETLPGSRRKMGLYRCLSNRSLGGVITGGLGGGLKRNSVGDPREISSCVLKKFI